MPIDDQRSAIAAEVRAALARHRKTQRDLAEVLGVPQSSVWLRLQGRRSFHAEEIAAISKWLAEPLARLMPTKEHAA